MAGHDDDALGATWPSGARPSGPIEGDTTQAGDGFADTFVRSQAPEVGGDAEPSTGAQVTEEHVGRYAGAVEVGRGGLGRVLSTYDRHLAREVAVKELLPEDGGSSRPSLASASRSQVVGRFLREARVTAQLEHPNIVPVYEVGRRPDDTLYYTMKLVRGTTLRAAIEQRLDLQDRLHLLPHFVDLCQAIAYAHSRGVIHRDIKPDNVMIGEFGETQVLDWGVAKLRGSEDLRGGELARAVARMKDEDSARTLPGSAFGTPVYMSPEQASGRIEAVDEKSDVWSLGVVLYQLLSGDLPYVRGNVYAILMKAANGDVRPLRAIAPDAPPELVAVVERALAVDPADRYPSAKDLADEVEAFASGGRVEAYEYSAWEVLKRYAAQHRSAVVVSAVSAALLLVVLAGAYAGLVGERDRARAAEQESRAHYAEVLVARAENLADDADWAGAELLARAALTEAPDPDARGLLLAAQVHLQPELLWKTRTYAGCAALSIVGEALWCATSFGVTRLGLEGGGAAGRLETPGGWIRSLSASPGGVTLGGDGGYVARAAPPGDTLGPPLRLGAPVVGLADLGGARVAVTEDGALHRLDAGAAVRLGAVTPPVAGVVSTREAVVVAHGEGRISVWRDGALTPWPARSVRPVTALAVAGGRVAVARGAPEIAVHDLGGRLQGTLRTRGPAAVSALGFLGPGLFAGTEDGHVVVLDPYADVVQARFVAHEGPVDRILAAPGRLITSGRDRQVRAYALRVRAPERIAAERWAGVAAVALDGGGGVALAGPAGLTWAGAAGARSMSASAFSAVALAPDGARLASGGADGVVHWIEVGEEGAAWTDLEADPSAVAALAVGPGAVYAAHADGALVRARFGDTRAEPFGPPAPSAGALAASADRVLAGQGGQAILRDAAGRVLGPLGPRAPDAATVTAVGLSPTWAVVGDASGAVEVYRLQDRALQARFQLEARPARAVALVDGTLRVLDGDGARFTYALAGLDAPAQAGLTAARARLGARLRGLAPVAE